MKRKHCDKSRKLTLGQSIRVKDYLLKNQKQVRKTMVSLKTIDVFLDGLKLSKLWSVRKSFKEMVASLRFMRFHTKVKLRGTQITIASYAACSAAEVKALTSMASISKSVSLIVVIISY